MQGRNSGVLMHITSLPSEFGIGTFGKDAYKFVDFLKKTDQTYWQILPLTTTSYGDSPYQSFSAIAGNTNLIDFELLNECSLLDESDYLDVKFEENEEYIDYELLFHTRRPILEKAVKNFKVSGKFEKEYEEFKKDNVSWLDNYSQFMAYKEHFDNKALQEWDDISLIKRDISTLQKYESKLAEEIEYHRVTQFFFFKQWNDLKRYANKNGIQIIGDMPIYVSADSVEVWTMPHLFKLDENKSPLYVAGVPADEFSDEGQYWGNPIYDWFKHREGNYDWWVYRIKESFKMYDVLRIDHFKGFSDFWQVDAKEDTAKNGTWQEGPGYELFWVIKERLGDLPIIAENLGYIDDKANKLLADTAFPGMKILEFGFLDESGTSLDLPHNYTANSVAYTGTHDNDVVNSWYDSLTENQKKFADKYMKREKEEPITRAMLRTLYASVSNTTITCMQDLLDLGSSSRMNTPNTVGENWKWRMKWEDLTEERESYFKELTNLYQRGK
ncbi:4-alpha-glucanotransferase [Gemella sp. 19428wG2_WT2a]|nr:4-alpha-glucanotransferase [Gemella sp. 19428wG2_WT2a]TFU60293.1 4-alpha-glucanotransferase [Gemella sp. WT2a]